jgi:hypothetical protein
MCKVLIRIAICHKRPQHAIRRYGNGQIYGEGSNGFDIGAVEYQIPVAVRNANMQQRRVARLPTLNSASELRSNIRRNGGVFAARYTETETVNRAKYGFGDSTQACFIRIPSANQKIQDAVVTMAMARGNHNAVIASRE